MDTLVRHVGFVKEQQSVHEKLARRFEGEQWRRDLHIRTASNFSTLADDLVTCQRMLDEAEERSAASTKNVPSLSLTPDEIADLPSELVKELSISDADKLEFQVLSLVERAGGILNLDRILIGLWRETGEVYKRNIMTSKLYRMVQKGLLFSVPGKKGVYSTEELADNHPPLPQRESPQTDSDGALPPSRVPDLVAARS